VDVATYSQGLTDGAVRPGRARWQENVRGSSEAPHRPRLRHRRRRLHKANGYSSGRRLWRAARELEDGHRSARQQPHQDRAPLRGAWSRAPCVHTVGDKTVPSMLNQTAMRGRRNKDGLTIVETIDEAKNLLQKPASSPTTHVFCSGEIVPHQIKYSRYCRNELEPIGRSERVSRTAQVDTPVPTPVALRPPSALVVKKSISRLATVQLMSSAHDTQGRKAQEAPTNASSRLPTVYTVT